MRLSFAALLALLLSQTTLCARDDAADDDKRPAVLTIDAGGHLAPINEVLFTPDSKRLISISDDRTIHVWTSIYLHHLFTYVFDEVQDVSGGRQHPFLNLPWTVHSFPIAK